MNSKAMKDVDLDSGEKEFSRWKRLLVHDQRREKEPFHMNASRRKRIAAGSASCQQDQ